MSSAEKVFRQKLIEELDNLCDKLDRKYDINCGGCCYIAYLISLVLSTFNIKYKLTIYDHEVNFHKKLEIRNNIRNNRGFPCRLDTANHYAISISGKTINKSSFSPWPGKHLSISYIKPEEIKEMYTKSISYIKPEEIKEMYTKGDWNDYYNRSHNGHISKLFYKIIKKYEKESKKRVDSNS